MAEFDDPVAATPDLAADAVITFRPLTRDDLAQFGRWLDDPVVHRWWPDPHEPDQLEADYGPGIDGDAATEVFVAELAGRPVGVIQRYPMDSEVEWSQALTAAVPDLAPSRSAGIDYLLGPPEVRGRGIGSRAIGCFTAQLWPDWPGVDLIVVAVQQENPASWRALERCGYRRVWAGQLDSPDPSDAGPAFVLVIDRP